MLFLFFCSGADDRLRLSLNPCTTYCCSTTVCPPPLPCHYCLYARLERVNRMVKIPRRYCVVKHTFTRHAVHGCTEPCVLSRRVKQFLRLQRRVVFFISSTARELASLPWAITSTPAMMYVCVCVPALSVIFAFHPVVCYRVPSITLYVRTHTRSRTGCSRSPEEGVIRHT